MPAMRGQCVGFIRANGDISFRFQSKHHCKAPLTYRSTSRQCRSPHQAAIESCKLSSRQHYSLILSTAHTQGIARKIPPFVSAAGFKLAKLLIFCGDFMPRDTALRQVRVSARRDRVKQHSPCKNHRGQKAHHDAETLAIAEGYHN